MIRGLHHNAWRCSDSEATRQFYEDFLGLRLVNALRIETTQTGRAVRALHTFYAMGDGSCLAFFEVPDQPFAFTRQHDFDLHIALEVDHLTLEDMTGRARAEGRELRGPVDHGFIRSIYLRDPDGYVVELAARLSGHAAAMDPEKTRPHATLLAWQAAKAAAAAPAGSAAHGKRGRTHRLPRRR